MSWGTTPLECTPESSREGAIERRVPITRSCQGQLSPDGVSEASLINGSVTSPAADWVGASRIATLIALARDSASGGGTAFETCSTCDENVPSITKLLGNPCRSIAS